jgi:hypothetical protein
LFFMLGIEPSAPCKLRLRFIRVSRFVFSMLPWLSQNSWNQVFHLSVSYVAGTTGVYHQAWFIRVLEFVVWYLLQLKFLSPSHKLSLISFSFSPMDTDFLWQIIFLYLLCSDFSFVFCLICPSLDHSGYSTLCSLTTFFSYECSAVKSIHKDPCFKLNMVHMPVIPRSWALNNLRK